MLLNSKLELLISGAYSEGLARFGDLGLTLKSYSKRVTAITEKYLGSSPLDEDIFNFIKGLHGTDLYLATACAQESLMPETNFSTQPRTGLAWKALEQRYRAYISDLARFFFRKSFVAQDLADNILADLFLPDRTGTSRIVSYDGRSSLNTWLRVVICNQAINAKRRSSYSQTTEIAPDIPDYPAWKHIDHIVRFHRYESPLKDSLATACHNLEPRERLLLLWRYQEGLQLGQIAQLLGIHQSNVTRQLERLKTRIRNRVTTILATKHNMSRQAIQECFSDVAENPVHTISILDFLKAPTPEKIHCMSQITTKIRPAPSRMANARSVRPYCERGPEVRRAT